VKIINCEQGTPEWHAARAGKVTASKITDVTAKGKGSAESATRRNYRIQIVTEILTGKATEQGFVSKEMAWGTENEPYARMAYEVQRDVSVDQVGFVYHPTIERAGASPDGLLGFDGENCEGLLEIKCPLSATHISYILADEVPADYQPQMLWQMACTGAQWCDFVSFDPRLPEHLQLFIKRFPRDQARIDAITAEVLAFLREVDELLAQLAKARPFTEPTPDTPGQIIAPAPAIAQQALERPAHGADGGGGYEAVPL
jgi:putative phage-type endonuclease